jgi:hypothetical protein
VSFRAIEEGVIGILAAGHSVRHTPGEAATFLRHGGVLDVVRRPATTGERPGAGRTRPWWRRGPVTRRVATRPLLERDLLGGTPEIIGTVIVRVGDDPLVTVVRVSVTHLGRHPRSAWRAGLAWSSLGSLTSRPLLEGGAYRKRRGQAVRLLVGQGPGRRDSLGETAVAVVGASGTLVPIVLEGDERAGRRAVRDGQPSVRHPVDDTRGTDARTPNMATWHDNASATAAWHRVECFATLSRCGRHQIVTPDPRPARWTRRGDMRLRHRLVGALGAILIAFVLAAPVAADTTGGGNGTSASAFHDGGCTDNGDGTVTCLGTELDAFKGKVSGDEVCYDDFTTTYDENTGEPVSSHESFGCAENPGTVSANKLTSVGVASTDIALETIDCVGFDCTFSDGGTLSVDATWTGIGKTFKSSSSQHYRDPSCVEVDRNKSTSRNATFDGPFDATFAQIAIGTSSFRIRCK